MQHNPKGLLVNYYRVRLRHDAGTVTVTTAASTLEAAIASILTAEHAPARAVISARQIRAPR